jgi:RNA methyltransferase, TrmH family
VITSVDNLRVKEVVRLRRARERRREGVFIAEGPREVGRALAAGLVARAVYLAPELLPDWEREHPDPNPPQHVSPRVLAAMAYRAHPEGVLAVFETPYAELPQNATLVLVAVDVEKPGNLGAMVRTADAAGADALLFAGADPDPWNPNAIRASTGAVFTLPIVETTLEDVTALPLQKIAAVVGAPVAYTSVDMKQPTALLVGAEDAGLDADWCEAADMQVAIPMHAHTVDSLNAATSAAILLFEAVRQRG